MEPALQGTGTAVRTDGWTGQFALCLDNQHWAGHMLAAQAPKMSQKNQEDISLNASSTAPGASYCSVSGQEQP